VTTQDRAQLQQNTVGGGHVSGESLPLHFGLGTADAAVVTVVWPDGTRSEDPAVANGTLVLVHPRDR
jgi:hypothetical protein